MERKEAIRGAYRMTGGNNFYDGMITCSTLSGKAVCRLVWAMNKAENDAYLEKAMSGIPEHFSGKLREVPVGTGILSGNTQITAASALALSLGIDIQNFPEGAIISMPLRAEGERKGRAFLGGVLSGVVEPIGAVLTLLAAQLVIPALPYLLSFAAGAMLYVVVEELIPEMSQGKHSNLGTIFFAVGFSVMMTLDVALG